MFSPHKNSYLQLVCAMNPRVINKAVTKAMRRRRDPHDEIPAAQRLESMQPSLYAPCVDVTRAQLGFGRRGLRLLNRQLHSDDSLEQLQAIHTVLDRVQISEDAMFLINLNIVYRLIDMMLHRDPIVREKICQILTHLSTYYQGRQRIMSRNQITENLMWMIMRDRKEIRYAAAYALKVLAKDRCACNFIMKTNNVTENLLKMVKNDHRGIVALHLQTLSHLIEWDPEPALKANAFQIMLTLFEDEDSKIVVGAMSCMTQLCKHSVGKKLADINDLTYFLRPYLSHKQMEVILSTVELMAYTTLTTRSKWRAKEFANNLTRRLVKLCIAFNKPALQIRAMQVLINLADCPDIRNHLKMHWEEKIKSILIRTHENWDGTTETSSYGLETGHHYRTMCIEGVETIKNCFGDNPEVVNVHSYLRRVQYVKEHLIKAINFKSYKN